MKQRNSLIILFVLTSIVLISVSFASAIVVDANYITLYPGEEGSVTLDVDNNFNYDIDDVSVALVLNQLPFTTVGSSEQSEDKINEDDSENFVFRIRPSTDIKPGDYSIPYVVTYRDNNDDIVTKNGSFGLRVSAKTDLAFSVETDNNIVGQAGKINLEIINKGLGEVKSVYVTLNPQGYELTSQQKVFVGTIDAEDSDIVSFDVIFKSTNHTINAVVEYKDFDNKNQVQTVIVPVKAYTEDQAIELGLIKKSNSTMYIIVIVVLIVLFLIYRRRKKNKNRS